MINLEGYQRYQELMSKITSGELSVLLGSEKRRTADYLTGIFPVAIATLGLSESEPILNTSRESVEWKADRLNRDLASLQKNRLEIGPSKSQKNPGEVIVFLSDVVAGNGSEVFHQDVRDGYLSDSQRGQLQEKIRARLEGEAVREFGAEELDDDLADLSLYTSENWYYVSLLLQDAIARMQLWQTEQITPEKKMSKRFEQDRIFYWDCTYRYQDEEDRVVFATFNVGVELPNNLSAEEVEAAYNPKINMGIDLVKIASEKNAKFFIQIPDYERIEITPEQAEILVVTKAPLPEIVFEMLSRSHLAELQTINWPDWAFMSYSSPDFKSE